MSAENLKFAEDLKPGDVVRLMSSVHRMTVRYTDIRFNARTPKNSSAVVVCVDWHDSNGAPHEAEYGLQQLRLVQRAAREG